MKKQPFNNRQYIIGIVVMLGIMCTQYVLAADSDAGSTLNLDRVGVDIGNKLVTWIDKNIAMFLTLTGFAGATASPGDVRNRSVGAGIGIGSGLFVWGMAKSLIGV